MVIDNLPYADNVGKALGSNMEKTLIKGFTKAVQKGREPIFQHGEYRYLVSGVANFTHFNVSSVEHMK